MENRASGTDAEQLDLRQIEGPEAVIRVLQEASAGREKFQVLIKTPPMQLYDLLSQRGYLVKYSPQSSTEFIAHVQKRAAEGKTKV